MTDNFGRNQPIRLPGLKPALIPFANEDCKARGMLRVDTERRFLPRFKNRGLAPSNVSRRRTRLKKTILFLALILMSLNLLNAEGQTLYAGKTSNKTQYVGLTLGGDIWDFLQLQFDVMKYLKDDPGFYSDDPKFNRGDFLGVSLNFVLKLPIHLIPYLDQFDYIQPYLLVGRGYGLESLAADYFNQENSVDKKSGIFSKIRAFDSFGYGLVVMVSPTFGIKVDYRSMNLAEHKGSGLQSRSFNRVSFGICFGAYKKPIQKVKK